MKEIELGEAFKVDGKMYVITKSESGSDDVNVHGHIVLILLPTTKDERI